MRNNGIRIVLQKYTEFNKGTSQEMPWKSERCLSVTCEAETRDRRRRGRTHTIKVGWKDRERGENLPELREGG